MKTLKTITAGLLAMATLASADASTVVRITGSTAFRGSVQNAIKNMLGSGLVGYAWYTDPASGFSDFGKSTTSIFKGIITGGGSNVSGLSSGDYIFKCYWSGSVGGIQAVVQGTTPASQSQNWWLSETSNTLTVAGNQLTSPVYNDSTSAADGYLSDAFISTAKSYLASQGVSLNITGVDEATVGAVIFTMCKSPNAPAALTNINSLQYQNLQQSGGTTMTNLVGATTPGFVYAFGRDEDSGTRVGALSETSYGVGKAVNQYKPTFDYTSAHLSAIAKSSGGSGYSSTPTVVITNAPGDTTGSGATATAVLSSGAVNSVTINNAGSGYKIAPNISFTGGGGSGAVYNASITGATITEIDPWPSNTLFGVSYGDGDSGYVNGPDLAFATSQAASTAADANGYWTVANPAYFISYLSVGDAGIVGTTNILTFNGVAPSDSAIKNGSYTFWDYEHMGWKHTNGNIGVLTGIATQLFKLDSASSGSPSSKSLLVGSGSGMNVGKTIEGGLITNGNPYGALNAPSVVTH